jgi:hypothetical protein
MEYTVAGEKQRTSEASRDLDGFTLPRMHDDHRHIYEFHTERDNNSGILSACGGAHKGRRKKKRRRARLGQQQQRHVRAGQARQPTLAHPGLMIRHHLRRPAPPPYTTKHHSIPSVPLAQVQRVS